MLKSYKIFILTIICLASFLVIKNSSAKVLTYQDAPQAIVKIYTYIQDSDYYLKAIKEGSGVFINEGGLILTNSHVVTVKDKFDNDLPVAFKICLTFDITEKPQCEYSANLIAKDDKKDIALLTFATIGLTSNPNITFLPFADDDDYDEGDIVFALGYPEVGGDTMTSSIGTILGILEQYNLFWIKTDALVSFGSSGGALINLDGELLGITSRMNTDLGFAIKISSIRDWIYDRKNQHEIISSEIQTKMSNFIKEQHNLKSNDNFINSIPHIKLVKTYNWGFIRNNENSIVIYNINDIDGGYLSVQWIKTDTDANNFLDVTVKGTELSTSSCFGTGNATISNKIGRKMICSISGEELYYVYLASKNFIVKIDYYYGKDNVDKTAIKEILNKIVISDDGNNFIEQKNYENSNPYFKLNLSNNWTLLKQNSKSWPIFGQNSSIPEVGYDIYIDELTEGTQSLDNEAYLKFIQDKDIVKSETESLFNLEAKRYFTSSNCKINNELNNEICYKYEFIDEEDNDKVKLFAAGYRIREKDRVIIFKFGYLGEERELFEKYLKDFEDEVLANLTLGRIIEVEEDTESETLINETEETQPESQAPPAQTTVLGVEYSSPWVDIEEVLVKIVDMSLVNKLKGYILLQVEEHGEAWYIDPATSKKYYMKDGPIAYEMLRKFGLGITNADLDKIPVGVEERFEDVDSDSDGLADKLEEGLKTDPFKADTDGDGFTDSHEVLNNGYNPLGAGKLVYDNNLVNRLQGRILLQVESRGEAWYLNPKDGKRYYLKDGDAAYQIMRFLSLGINNENLRKISVGRLENL